MKKLKAIRTVYSYYFPEIRKIIDQLTTKYPHNIFLKSIKPGLDDFHLKTIEQYLKFNHKNIPNLENFSYRYFTNGSSEGIFHILAWLRYIKKENFVYVLKGEYEGYEIYAKYLGFKIKEIDLKKVNFKKLEKGVWFISNPSARDGNIIANEKILEICRAGHKLILDLSYVGLTKEYKFDVNHKNILGVLVSLSKPFGLFYYRIGFTFSREKVNSLESNIWFKNIFSLLIANKIFSSFRQDYFYQKYRRIQEKIIQKINQKTKLGIKKSDVVLLGYLHKKEIKKLNHLQMNGIKNFKRGDFYRFCLTPYFLELEKKKEPDLFQ